MDFKIGDWVYAGDWCYGEIVKIDGDLISVEFDTGCGGGTCTFERDEVQLVEERKTKPKVKIFEKRVKDNPIGRWNEYYIFGKKVYTKLVGLYKYE